MELQHLADIEQAAARGRGELLRLGGAFLFLVVVALLTVARGGDGNLTLVIAAMLAAYMAMNIGANDVANNVGPAVGAKALSLFGALAIATVFDAAGALIAGSAVVDTVRGSILEGSLIADDRTVVWIMLCALLASSVWLNVANVVGAPVSTTHSIVGAVLGAGVAARGLSVVNWETVGAITTSWLVSPLLGAGVAAGFLYIIKRTITYQVDMAGAARVAVPYMVAAMAWVFSVFLLVKGLDPTVKIGLLAASSYGAVLAIVVFLGVRNKLQRKETLLANTKDAVNRLFNLPLAFAAALLSFAHGSNDVANAIGPLAAVVDAVGGAAANATLPGGLPLWVLVIGAFGISVGLSLFGPRVIRTIGTEITELDQMRAFAIAMAAALTVTIASQLGLPVSSTHIVVGGVFGVGFLREFLKSNYERTVAEIKAQHPSGDLKAIEDFLARFERASVKEKEALLKDLKERSKKSQDPANFSKAERKGLRRVYKQALVKRAQLVRIAAAWVITVPASGGTAALFYHLLNATSLAR